jgi:hypothetical protein
VQLLQNHDVLGINVDGDRLAGHRSAGPEREEASIRSQVEDTSLCEVLGVNNLSSSRCFVRSSSSRGATRAGRYSAGTPGSRVRSPGLAYGQTTGPCMLIGCGTQRYFKGVCRRHLADT